MLRLPPLECWDYSYAQPHLVHVVLGTSEPGMHSAKPHPHPPIRPSAHSLHFFVHEHPQPSLPDCWAAQQKLGQGEGHMVLTPLDYHDASPTGRKGGWRGRGGVGLTRLSWMGRCFWGPELFALFPFILKSGNKD